MKSNKYLELFNKYSETVTDCPLPKTEENKKNPQENIIKDEPHIQIIGKAGIGKSTYINKNYSYHEYLLLSFTGIAASQINGNTISSVFKLGRFNENSVNTAINGMKFFNPHRVEQLRIAKGLVIDEFYTVPASIMEKVNIICKKLRECKKPFGGLKLILVGDDRQTKCVSDGFIDTELYKSLELKEIMLPEHPLMRLTAEYMKFCDLFRNPKLNRNKMIRRLSNSKFAQDEVEGYSVYYTNAEVNKRNKDEMASFEGDIIYKNYKKNMPIYITSSWGLLCNGMIGKLLDKKGKFLEIEVDEKKYEVKSNQIDFVPGFAMTIHRVQSKTFPGINVYIRKSDIIKDRSKYIRLIYVALTRVRHFDKCYICLY